MFTLYSMGLIGLLLVKILRCDINVKFINPEVLQNRKSTEKLLIELHFGKSYDFNMLKLCILINGLKCHCYDESIIILDIFIPRKCYIKSNFWFSIKIENDISSSIFIPSIENINNNFVSTDLLTLVLPLTLNDINRALILFDSLEEYVFNQLRKKNSIVIYELLVFVPDNQHDILTKSLSYYIKHFPFQINLIKESILFTDSTKYNNWLNSGIYSYAIQMAIKLLCSKIIHTNFYIVLDADVILINSLNITEILYDNKAIYYNENRYLYHPDWFEGSEKFLGITLEQSSPNIGFGVTPAILSTYGSLIVLSTIYNRILFQTLDVVNHKFTDNESDINYDIDYSMYENSLLEWIMSFGRDGTIWSEYTLYRIILGYFNVFDKLHISDYDKNCRLHCGNIWYDHQLPWEPEKIMKTDYQMNSEYYCLFSVVQSTVKIDASQLYKLFHNVISLNKLKETNLS